MIGVAAFGGIGVGSMGLITYKTKRKALMLLPYRKLAIDLLNRNTRAIELLGLPIKIQVLDAGDTFHNFVIGDQGRMRIELDGKNHSGDLFVWATKAEEEWKVNKLELRIKGLAEKKFLIHDDKQAKELDMSLIKTVA